jgi:hypothetical protein
MLTFVREKLHQYLALVLKPIPEMLTNSPPEAYAWQIPPTIVLHVIEVH